MTHSDAMVVDANTSDSDFISNPSGDDSNSDSTGIILNSEFADNLPMKLVPQILKSRPRSKVTTKPSPVKRAAVNGDGSVPPKNRQMSRASSENNSDFDAAQESKDKRCNPIYYFYVMLIENPEGTSVTGSKYYKSIHTGKVLQITARMNYSLNGLTNHLKNNVPMMYKLYEVLKARQPALPTEKEKAIASRTKKLSPRGMAKFLQGLKKSDGSISAAFLAQVEKAKGPFNQKEFKQLLIEWIIACNQQFEEVEHPQLRQLLEYTHHSVKPLHIPHRTTIKTHVMKMGKDKIDDIKKMFQLCICFTDLGLKELNRKVSISLDAWTSSNHYAFLAIVAHYVMNDGHICK
ncbi:hypothetical protein BDN71DRAFT_1507353 [Pleurotus eryngii]|uniref:Uncharacterized protein n=1 Tax=Pleurotus eryngii TaxID=5323 RepID=A0A9P5ZY75_PLEER|nr:hypothetical protein BDN71DRAFT_1507353 [Pleurotus eryngii]